MSLIESLKLHALEKNNIMRDDLSKPATHADIHRGFHYVVVRWVQAMGFGGVR